MDAIYSYGSHQVDVIDDEPIVLFCDQMVEAYAVSLNQGVVICPTTVGYTLITARNLAKTKSLKVRPDDKPCGILVTTNIYRVAFGKDPPLESDQFVKYTVGYVGKLHRLATESSLRMSNDAIGKMVELASGWNADR